MPAKVAGLLDVWAEVLLGECLPRPAGITQDVRDYTDAHVEAAIPEGMQKAEEFCDGAANSIKRREGQTTPTRNRSGLKG